MSSPKIIVFGQSEAWCSTIARSFQDADLSWVLSSESLLEESLQELGATAIIEISVQSVEKVCLDLVQLLNNSLQIKLFAVGDPRLADWHPLLNATGFAATFCGFLEVPALIRAVETHRASVKAITTSIESRVWSELPWPTASTDGQA